MRGRRLRICSRNRRQTSARNLSPQRTQGYTEEIGGPSHRPSPDRLRSDVRRLRSALWFLRWSQQNLAHERLRSLRHDRGHGMRDVIRLQHLVGIFSCVRTEFGID